MCSTRKLKKNKIRKSTLSKKEQPKNKLLETIVPLPIEMLNFSPSVKKALAKKYLATKLVESNDSKESGETPPTESTNDSHSSDTVQKGSYTDSTRRSKPTFEIGTIISSKWEITGELGSGGCGVVYRVERIKCSIGKKESLECPIGTIAAMKAEYSNRGYDETLKAEASVLRRMEWSKHFCRLYMAGSPKASGLNIVIMTLVGRSLSNLRKLCPEQHFTLSTACRLAAQCITSIKDLHSVGYLHRDIKASNFAIGAYADTCRTVFLLDFGFARPYRLLANSKLRHRKPRNRAPFMGTDRYCSINTHARVEQSRRDDLWSYLYMVVEMIAGTLPWRKAPPEELPFMKVKCMRSMLEKCPLGMTLIMEHLESLEYASQPDYNMILQVFNSINEKSYYLETDPYDWEAGGEFHETFKELTDINSLNSPSTQSSASRPLSSTIKSGSKQSPSKYTTESYATDGDETTVFETSWEELTNSTYESESESMDESDPESVVSVEEPAYESELNKSIRMITNSIKNLFTSSPK